MQALIGLRNFSAENFSAKCTTLSETQGGHVPTPPRIPLVNQTLPRHDVIWKLITIYRDDSCMGVPSYYDVIWGVPLNQNVTIYSDDSCMGVPLYDVI